MNNNGVVEVFNILDKAILDIKSYVSTIAPTLVRWLKEEKNVEVTEKEINEILSIIPLTAHVTPIKMFKSSITRQTKEEGTQCKYVIKRGKKNVGKRCTGRCYDDTGYCGSCKKKRAVEKILKEAMNNEQKDNSIECDESSIKLDLKEILNMPNHFLEKNNNFVIIGEKTVVGVMENNEIRKLTDEEENKVKSLGLNIDDNYNYEVDELSNAENIEIN